MKTRLIWLFTVLIVVLPATSLMANDVTGAFGYKFGEYLQKEDTLQRITSASPELLASYRIKPKVKNRDLDTYSATICLQSGIITNLSGFKLFDTRDEAMAFMDKYKRFLESKYGAFTPITTDIPDENFYMQKFVKNGSSVSVIVSNKPDSRQIAFMVMYDSMPLTMQCRAPW